MSGEPRSSPWGEVQHCEVLIDGVFLVSTAGHGGIMVRYNASEFLSDYALKTAIRENRCFCFEEDYDEQIVIRDLLDKKLWQLPDRIKDKTKFEDAINSSLQRWHPDYSDLRLKWLPLSERLRDGAGRAAEHNAAASSIAIPNHNDNRETR